MIAVGGEDLVRAVAIATDQPEDWLGELLPDEFLALVTAVVDVNTDFFRPAGTARAERRDGDDAGDTWGDAFAELLANGHGWPGVLDYAIAQVTAHLAAIRRREAERAALRMSAMRVAVWGEAKDVSKFLERLTGGIHAPGALRSGSACPANSCGGRAGRCAGRDRCRQACRRHDLARCANDCNRGQHVQNGLNVR